MRSAPNVTLLAQRIFVLAAHGATRLERNQQADYRGAGRFACQHTDVEGNHDRLVLTQPEIESDFQRRCLKARAELLENSSFNANRISIADLALQPARKRKPWQGRPWRGEWPMFSSRRNSPTPASWRACSDRATRPPRPPYVNNLVSRSITCDGSWTAYLAATRGLVGGGADILHVEMIFDTDELQSGAVRN